jgi:hypothetical protein
VSAFADLRAILDRALDAERGLILRVETPGKAINLVQKINYFRRNERNVSREVYPPEHPMFNRTQWDGLRVFRPSTDSCEVHIDQLSVDILEVREL